MSIDRSYVRTSSLARKFFEDFPEATELPLLLPAEQKAALQQYVRPLLNLEDTSTAGCCDAVKQLLPVFSAAWGLETYRSARAAADYVQSPLVSVCAVCAPPTDDAKLWAVTHSSSVLSCPIKRRRCASWTPQQRSPCCLALLRWQSRSATPLTSSLRRTFGAAWWPTGLTTQQLLLPLLRSCWTSTRPSKQQHQQARMRACVQRS